jgi:hypothetical protein
MICKSIRILRQMDKKPFNIIEFLKTKRSLKVNEIALLIILFCAPVIYSRYFTLPIDKNAKKLKCQAIKCLKSYSKFSSYLFKYEYNGKTYYTKDGASKDAMYDCDCVLKNEYTVVLDSLNPNNADVIFTRFWAERYGLKDTVFPCVR